MKVEWTLLFACMYLHIDLLLLEASVRKYVEYEILTPGDIVVQSRVTSRTSTVLITAVKFTAFHELYTLSLFPDTDIVHPQAVAKLVDENNTETRVHISREKIFSGTANNDPRQRVSAAEVNGVWIIHIRSAVDLLSLEPLKWYNPSADPTLMVVYKGWREFVWQKSTFVRQPSFAREERRGNCTSMADDGNTMCSEYQLFNKINRGDAVLEDTEKTNSSALPKIVNQHMNFKLKRTRKDICYIKNKFRISHDSYKSDLVGLRNEPASSSHHYHKRFRRYIDPRHRLESTECDLMVIVDYNLFKQLGAETHLVISTMTMVYKYSDEIFRRTKFESSPSCGIVIREFRIHTNYTDQEHHYNSRWLGRVKPDTMLDLLRNSTGSDEFYDFCLVALNCKRKFSPSAAGQSYYAQAHDDLWSAGICGMFYEDHDTPTPSNVLFITEPSSVGFDIIKFALVATHEVGHAWGSHHDNITNGCRQPARRYVMNRLTLAKKEINSVRFSTCSVREISIVLKIRRQKCFLSKASLRAVCGDGQVEDAVEDCEPRDVKGGRDPCCAESCVLVDGADCSPRVDPCCTSHCSVAPGRRRCELHPSLWACHPWRVGECTGNDSHTCPPLTPALPDGSACDVHHSVCQAGRCVSHCSRLGLALRPSRRLLPCSCPGGENQCALCCRQADASEFRHSSALEGCERMDSFRLDGLTCHDGVCRNGSCQAESVVPELTADLDLFVGKGDLLTDNEGMDQMSSGPGFSVMPAEMLLLTVLVCVFTRWPL